jgi:hypothetical protein
MLHGGAPPGLPADSRVSAQAASNAQAAAVANGAPATIAQVGWMAGAWFAGGASSTAEERWTPAAGGVMLGVARTLRGDRMTGFEFLRISERDGSLVYSAMPNGRSPATDFVLTRIDARSATFENPAHDFPKMIRYTMTEDGTLEAVVSGDGSERPQTFRFKRQSAPGW